jgi:Ser/Thr protein kinase RdoA (MazF antagonist)
MSHTALTTGAVRAHGQITARLGRALRGFFDPAADYDILWDITRLPLLRPLLTHVGDGPRRAQAERVLDRFEARVAPALPGLRAQVIHADMSLDNVLYGDGLRVSGIVDFGDMTHAPLVCDLAVAVADVLHGRDDAIEAADALIGGYVSVTPLEGGGGAARGPGGSQAGHRGGGHRLAPGSVPGQCRLCRARRAGGPRLP